MRRAALAAAAALATVAVALWTSPPRARAAGPMAFAVRDTGRMAGEPTVGVLSDGSIVYQAWTDVIRSSDQGKTWTVIHNAVTGEQTSDPYLHVDETTGRIWSSQLVGVPSAPGGQCQTVAISSDGGAEWIEDAQCGTVDHQKIGSGPWSVEAPISAYPRAVYTCSNRVADTGCAISLDGGLTWGPQVPAFAGIDPGSADGQLGVPGLCGGLAGDPVSGPDGSIYVPKEHCGRPFVAVSRDAGATWTARWVAEPARTRPLAMGANNPSVTVGADGVVYYAWTGDDWRNHVARSADRGQTWTEVFISSQASTTFPLVIAARAGTVATVYVGTDDTAAGPDAAPASTRWHLYAGSSFDGGSTWETAQVTPTDDPVMVGCIGRHGPACGNGVLLDFNDVALTRDGRLVVSYTDACYPRLCLDAASSRRRDGFLAVQVSGPTLR